MMKMAAVIFAGVLAMAIANAQETGAPGNSDPMGSSPGSMSAPADPGMPAPTKAKKKHKKKKSTKKHSKKKKHHSHPAE